MILLDHEPHNHGERGAMKIIKLIVRIPILVIAFPVAIFQLAWDLFEWSFEKDINDIIYVSAWYWKAWKL